MQHGACGMLLLWDWLVWFSRLIPAQLARSFWPPPRDCAGAYDVVAGGSVIPGDSF